MLLSIAVNFIFGKKVCKDNIQSNRKIWLVMSIVFNISMLGIFKYTGFFIENINRVFKNNITDPGIALPLGISFFTFQAMSYVIDVYRDDARVQKNLLHLALYISLFPQLVAGPIVRYQTVADQIENRKHTMQKFENGVSRFIIGLAKKVLLSNSLGMLADSVFNTQISELTVLSAWLGIIAYSLQIFFDFSGYSDMAIGLGNMFGFEFLENFNYPYISKSASEFWRRWHISLGSWFRDYIYIPLGGSKKGKLRNYINLFIVWFLTGFWHGASWTFIAWGLYFGVLIAIEKAFLGKILDRIYSPISHLYLVLVVMIGWIFFRANSFTYAFNYIKLLFGLDNNLLYNNLTIMYLNDYGYIIVLSVIFSVPIIPIFKNKLHEFKETHVYYIIRSIVFMSMFGAIVIELVNSTYNPFLYFRF
ncbi:MBOAT family O-acyltransferase [Paraclostridium sordellii]|nr:MBOAT family O-acyltransferase [Paeniclostridium sordellii]